MAVIKNPNFKNEADFYRSLMARGVGARDFPNSHTEVEYLGNGKFGASISTGHRVFFDKADGNKPKKHKLTDERPSKDYVLIQSAKCCVEVYPYYAKYFDVQHEEVRLYEERWVVQRLFKEPDDWRDVDAYNPVMTVEEYSEPAGDVVKVTVTYDTDYGILTVEYFQRDGNALKHNITFTNTSGSTETFRVLQRWAGIVGAKCNGKDFPVAADEPFLAFHRSDKPQREFTIAENLWSMIFNPDGTEKTEKCLQRPVRVESHAQGMKADFIYAQWLLAQNESLVIDPDTATLDDPTEDGYIDCKDGIYIRYKTQDYVSWGGTVGSHLNGYVEWPIGSLAGFTITKVEFRYNGVTNIGFDSYIYAMANQPSAQSDDDAGNQVIYDDAEDGTAYLIDSTFPEIGTGKDVGGASGPAWDTDPKTDLQSAIDASRSWFAFGFHGYWGAGTAGAFNSEDKTDAADPKPTLYVEYILLSVPVADGDLIGIAIIKRS